MIRNVVRLFCTKKPLSSTKLVEQIITKAEQVTNSDQQMQALLEQRIKNLQKLHQQTQDIIDSKLKFPVKLCGTNDQYESRFAYLPDRIMSYYRIPQARITDYLLKMFKASLYAIADRNTQYMQEYWQEGLTTRTLLAIDQAKKNNFKIQVEKDSNFLQQIPETCQIIDSIMLRGLSLNRTQNKDPKQYIKYSEADDVGLITFTPKNITENNENFIDPQKNKAVYQGYDRMLLRVLVRIKSPLRLNIPEFKIPNDVYTWQHLCIMQNQMVPMKPLESNYKLETLMEWLGKYRFGPWRVVDIDNFMLGNSPFRKYQTQVYEIDPIFKNTKLDKSSHIDIRMI